MTIFEIFYKKTIDKERTNDLNDITFTQTTLD